MRLDRRRFTGVRTAGVVLAVAATLTACQTGSSGGASSVTSAYASAPASQSSAVSSPASPAAAADACGAPELSRMTLRQKLAQLIVVGVTGTEDATQVVRREHIGGIFVGSWTDKSILTSGAARRLSRSQPIPLMVTVDQEGGRVSRLSSLGIDSPSARELARTKTPGQVRTVAASIGRQLAELGITVDFAPDADVSDESADEVIGDRSFSNDPQVVTEYAGAFAAGLEDAGIMPVYKHFPGHGHGSGDSHTGVVRTPPLSSLITSDLVPYRTLLRDPGNAGVMVGHLIVPGLTGEETPSSISPRAMTMLRTGKPYGGPAFNGVVFSDDLSGMAAISERYPIEQAALMSIKAGGDIALWITTDRVSAVLDAMQRAVTAGTLTQARVDRSVVRILRAKGVLHC
ncbi:glycoside hydrolase family 3 protein [Gordonia otitidis]|uniref:glycoside hydrolase family 3 N-terminal domain-containing protein n=1 Tax=Gordonia otitidis TaxID=249058 RepID=UPI001D149D7F|nr:glycoside hydrolase family 3 N-terminal domain-containing protein [Gordonia otitidis]UEA61294.1 glycoside hydrolase family 3 protein [Gordonia otitidis]